MTSIYYYVKKLSKLTCHILLFVYLPVIFSVNLTHLETFFYLLYNPFFFVASCMVLLEFG